MAACGLLAIPRFYAWPNVSVRPNLAELSSDKKMNIRPIDSANQALCMGAWYGQVGVEGDDTKGDPDAVQIEWNYC